MQRGQTRRMTTAPQARSADRPPRVAVRLVAAVLGLALFAAAMWFAWLGWDDDYHLVDGVPQGPYRAWQVVGCALSIALAAVLAQLWVRRVWAMFLLAPAAVIGFAIPWSVEAAGSDDSGLWIVGLLFLLIGGGVALLVVLGLTAAVVSVVSGRRPTQAPASP